MPKLETTCTKCGGRLPLTLNVAGTVTLGACPDCTLIYRTAIEPPSGALGAKASAEDEPGEPVPVTE